jgi:predicted DNA-binding transcriptional regulator AlpA
MSERPRIPLTFDDGYLPLPELSTYSGLSVRTLRDHLRDPAHPLPHFQIGGRVVVKRSEYDRWAEQFHRHSAAAPEDALALDILASMRAARH